MHCHTMGNKNKIKKTAKTVSELNSEPEKRTEINDIPVKANVKKQKKKRKNSLTPESEGVIKNKKSKKADNGQEESNEVDNDDEQSLEVSTNKKRKNNINAVNEIETNDVNVKKKKRKSSTNVENELEANDANVKKKKRKNSLNSANELETNDANVKKKKRKNSINAENDATLNKKKLKDTENNKDNENDEHEKESSSDDEDDDKLKKSKKKKKIQDANPDDASKKKVLSPEEIAEIEARTIFVKNINISLNRQKITKYFMKYGKVETTRIRAVPRADVRTPKKVAYIKKEFHAGVDSVIAYVRFVSKESAQKALVENGSLWKDKHIAVTLSSDKPKGDFRTSLFVGNVDFGAQEEDLWKLFGEIGAVDSIRLIRDRVTNASKGFAFVNFKDSDSIELVMQSGELKLNNKVLRVKRWEGDAKKKRDKRNTASGIRASTFRAKNKKSKDENAPWMAKTADNSKPKKFSKAKNKKKIFFKPS